MNLSDDLKTQIEQAHSRREVIAIVEIAMQKALRQQADIQAGCPASDQLRKELHAVIRRYGTTPESVAHAVLALEFVKLDLLEVVRKVPLGEALKLVS